MPDLESAVRAMVKPGESVEPEPDKVAVYAERCRAFREACSLRGYE